jgi:predicted glycosyltransferase
VNLPVSPFHLQYSRANSKEEKRDLFFVLFDYVVHQINETCLSSGLSTYTYDDAQPLASLLASADAPEAFYISVKHGVEGVGDMLTKAISAALSQSAEYEQLNVVMSSPGLPNNYLCFI